jgi:hypothetical protein
MSSKKFAVKILPNYCGVFGATTASGLSLKKTP